jgi:hypothetical protein
MERPFLRDSGLIDVSDGSRRERGNPSGVIAPDRSGAAQRLPVATITIR